VVLSNRQVNNLEFNLVSLGDTTRLWRDSDVLVDLSLPYEIEVKFSAVLENHFLCLSLVYEEFAEVELVGFSCLQFYSSHSSEDRVVDFVSFSFHVKNQGAGFSLDIAEQVVVVVQLVLGLEQYFNWNLGLCRDSSRNGIDSKRISEVWASSDALFGKAEAERNMLLVDQLDGLSILSLKKQRPKLDLSCLEQYIWLIYSSYDQEVLDDVLGWNPKDPMALMLSNVIRSVLEDHFRLLSTKD